jgi:uncharacterized protein YjbI with pentapeptide repeats
MPPTVILEGHEAIDLWQQGRDAWNEWVDQNPDAKVDFSNADSSKCDPVSFEYFHFPNGGVSFREANFGNRDVNFFAATFGKGNVSFKRATFSGKEVSFRRATFYSGFINFRYATFNSENITFETARFLTGDVVFGKTKFSPSVINFSDVNFGGRFILKSCFRTQHIKDLIFAGCDFKSGVMIAAELKTIPDLRGSNVLAHFDLEDLTIDRPEVAGRLSSVSINEDHIFTSAHIRLGRALRLEGDAAKYRRLKELAEQNRDHEAALRFFAAERRCVRWPNGPEGRKSILSYAEILPELTYDELSNYGQSIGRPVVCLLGLIALTGTLYWSWADYTYFLSAFEITLSDSIPFMPLVRQIGPETDTVLATAPYAWRVLHRASSFILLFLIGLGLRNRLRL